MAYGSFTPARQRALLIASQKSAMKRRGKGFYVPGHNFKQAVHMPNRVFAAGSGGTQVRRRKKYNRKSY